MAKQIEETHSIKIGANNFHIVARNWNIHSLAYMKGGEVVEVFLTVEELIEFGKFIIDTAYKIDSDADFNEKA